MWILLLRDSYVLQIRSFRSEDHPYRYKKTYEKVHNISPLYRCFRCDALLESARPGGFRIANWDPPQCPRALAWRVCLLGRPPFTSLSLRSLRLAHKSTSKLVLLVLVTRVCQAAFREVRSRRGETIDFQRIAAVTRGAINTPLRWPPPWDPPEFSWGPQSAGCAAVVASGALSASS